MRPSLENLTTPIKFAVGATLVGVPLALSLAVLYLPTWNTPSSASSSTTEAKDAAEKEESEEETKAAKRYEKRKEFYSVSTGDWVTREEKEGANSKEYVLPSRFRTSCISEGGIGMVPNPFEVS